MDVDLKAVKKIFHDLPIVVYSALPDEHSTTILVTDAIKNITGYSADEFYKKPKLWEEIIYNEDKCNVWKSIQKHRKNKTPLNVTYRIVTKAGDIRWLKDEAIPVLDQHNQIIRIDGYLEDITELKKIRDQIRHQSELVDIVSDAIISTDSDFNIKSWNNAAEKIYGYTAKEAIRKRMQNLVDVKYGKEKRKDIIEQLLHKGHWTGETIQKGKDGQLLTIYSSVNLIKDDRGNFIGTVAVNRDISDLKKVEQEIKDLSKFPSENPSPVFRVDSTGTILFANNSAKKFIKTLKNNGKNHLPAILKESIDTVLKIKKIKQVEFNQGKKTFFFSIVPIKNTDYINIYGMDITKEVNLRNALNKAKSNSEIKVKERTAELQETNKRLEEENQNRIRALQSLQLEEARLDALLHLNQISETTLEKITNFTLEQAIALTQSKIGFIGFLNEDETIYILHSVSINVVKDCKVAGNPIHWPVAEAGIWADAIRTRKTLIVNDYNATLPGKKGIPKGHLSLKRFMVVPILDEKKIVAVAGVANKTGEYDKSDERQIFLLLSGMWSNVQKNRSREELQKAYDDLEKKVKQRTSELAASAEALQKSEERYRLAQKAAAIGSWDWNIKTGNLIWSDEIEPMFGFKKGKFKKTYEAFLECIHPEDQQSVLDSVNACLEKDIEYDIEHRIIWPDSSIHWVKETGDVLRNKKGKAIRMLGIVQEITNRKKTENQIKKLNKSLWQYTMRLEEANKEVEAFSYSVSHDLRAPLRSIDGFSQALLEDYADKLDADGTDYLNRVRNASQRMGQLIDGMLLLSRLSRTEMHVEKVDMGDIAKSVINKFKKEDPTRKIEFIVHDNLFSEGDKNLLEILLENLLGNAWKFTSKRPKGKIEFGKNENKNETVFFIKDNGAGFDMKYVDKLFVPFQRLHDAEFPGDGIGLGIVSRVIRRHGGRIWAEGEVGKGAIFNFTLGGRKND